MIALKIKPYAHQITGAKWLLQCRTRGERGSILADEMGLGKTITALLAAKVHKQIDPTVKILVIAPKSLGINWKKEAALVGVTLDNVYTNHVASFPEGQKGKFLVIVDEAHAFQNISSNRTRQFLALLNGEKSVKHETKDVNGKVTRTDWETVKTGDECVTVLLLTGTPLKNGRPINLLPLLRAINHKLVSTFSKIKEYKEVYCGPQTIRTPRGTITTFDGATNLDQLHTLTQPSILRRLSTDCLDLPELTRVVLKVELTPEEQQKYDAHLNVLKAEYQRRLRKGEIKDGGEKLILLTQLRKVGSVAKVPATIELTEEILEQNGQTVIFTEFRESAEAIAAHFGVPAYTGDTSVTQRNTIVENFQEGKQKVFVGIGKAGGVGLTLHANGKCRNVILVDRPWTPGDAEQEEKRAHRIGQTNAVLSNWLQLHTVDETIDNILNVKKENSENVLSGERIAFEFKSPSDIADAVLDALGW